MAELEKEAAVDALIESEKRALIGTMAQTLAHEIRNPLSTITMAVSLLNNELQKLQNPQLTEYANISLNNVKRIDNLIKQLLNLRNLNRHKIKVDIINLLDEALLLTEDRLKLNKIKVIKKYTYTCELMLDKENMQIALLTIISNAIEAMEPGKGILEITTKKKDEAWIISIRDNGHGITEENLAKIFDPLFSSKNFGIGLGLYYTKEIIKQNNGTIEVESKIRKGTVFILKFPFNHIANTSQIDQSTPEENDHLGRSKLTT